MAISTTDLNPGDIYMDQHGHIWVVEHYCMSPTVKMKRVHGGGSVVTQGGGVDGLMWDGFSKIAKGKNVPSPSPAPATPGGAHASGA